MKKLVLLLLGSIALVQAQSNPPSTVAVIVTNDNPGAYLPGLPQRPEGWQTTWYLWIPARTSKPNVVGFAVVYRYRVTGKPEIHYGTAYIPLVDGMGSQSIPIGHDRIEPAGDPQWIEITGLGEIHTPEDWPTS